MGDIRNLFQAALNDRALLGSCRKRQREFRESPSRVRKLVDYLGLNECPQPQVSVAFGLFNLNPSPMTVST